MQSTYVPQDDNCLLTSSRAEKKIKLLLKCCNILIELVLTSEVNRTHVMIHSCAKITQTRDFLKNMSIFTLLIIHVIFESCFHRLQPGYTFHLKHLRKVKITSQVLKKMYLGQSQVAKHGFSFFLHIIRNLV